MKIKDQLVIAVIALLMLFLLFGTFEAKAQVRDATPAEQKALDKAIAAITDALDRFNNNDWNKEQDFYSGQIGVHPTHDVPMDVDNNFERQYHVQANSERYNTLIQPLQQKINDALQQGDNNKVLELGKQLKALSWLTVDVYINRRVVNVFAADKGKNIKLSSMGAGYCYQIKKDQYGNNANSYWLLFGNWQTATNGGYGLTYHFKHPPVTPYIENIAITITGADDRIQELLKTINWSELQDALTP